MLHFCSSSSSSHSSFVFTISDLGENYYSHSNVFRFCTIQRQKCTNMLADTPVRRAHTKNSSMALFSLIYSGLVIESVEQKKKWQPPSGGGNNNRTNVKDREQQQKKTITFEANRTHSTRTKQLNFKLNLHRKWRICHTFYIVARRRSIDPCVWECECVRIGFRNANETNESNRKLRPHLVARKSPTGQAGNVNNTKTNNGGFSNVLQCISVFAICAQVQPFLWTQKNPLQIWWWFE